jgi:hypothetical protein
MSYPSEHTDIEYAQLQSQIEEALGIIDDLADLNFRNWRDVKRNCEGPLAQSIVERIAVLRLKQ